MKILLATDGSEHSLKAAAQAKWLADLDPSIEVLVLHVLPQPITVGQALRSGVALRYSDYVERFADAGGQALERTVDALDLPAERVTTRLLIGVPAEVICSVATEEKVGMVVMGSRGESLVEGLLLGSTAYKVVQLAPCPVLLVR